MSDQQQDRDTDPDDRLDALGRRLHGLDRTARASQSAQREPAPMGRALQLGVDIAAGVGVGAFIGLMLDRLLATGPWLMIVFLFVGFAAGVRNVIRRASEFGVEDEAKNLDIGDEN